MERDDDILNVKFAISYFNSHAHVERDMSPDIITNPPYISTHTLTWSVTDISDEFEVVKGISTHTLTWSVTFVANALPMANGYFNSHAHVERDSALLILIL